MLEVINFSEHSTSAYVRGKYLFIWNNCVCLQQLFVFHIAYDAFDS